MKYTKIVDLTIPLTNNTPIYPGDPVPLIQQAASISQDGYNVSTLELGSHTGTHVDAPYHIISEGNRMDEAPLEQFMGEGVVIDVRGKKAGTAITLSDIEPFLTKVNPGIIVLFHTGWSHYTDSEEYYNHPYIELEVIETLLKQGVHTFFIDALNIDPPDGSSFLCHEAITAANGIIGENFTNFDQIDFEHPFIIALPLKLAGIDGSPVRAVALKTVHSP